MSKSNLFNYLDSGVTNDGKGVIEIQSHIGTATECLPEMKQNNKRYKTVFRHKEKYWNSM